MAQTRNQGRVDNRQGDETRISQVFVDQDIFAQQDAAALRRSLLDPNALVQSGIVNLLRIPGEQQVMLRVTVAEINRSALRSIVADVSMGDGDVNFLSLVANTNFGAVPGAGNLLVNVPDFRLALNALREVNLARTLAEPNLVALEAMPNIRSGGQRTGMSSDPRVN